MRSRVPAKVDVFGTSISLINYETVLECIENPPSDRAATVVVCNVHSVMTARREPELSEALAAADVATPDGMPLVWVLRHGGNSSQSRVYGPELMLRALKKGQEPGWRHFLYGTTDSTLRKLRDRINQYAPGAQIVGSIAPPFRPLSDAEEARNLEEMRKAEPDIVWVGLGMPKQELWMHRVGGNLPRMTLIGVGAAFDILAGNVRMAPSWMQRFGLEWVFRLAQEPRRLWKRYVLNNPAFLLAWGRTIVIEKARTRRTSTKTQPTVGVPIGQSVVAHADVTKDE